MDIHASAAISKALAAEVRAEIAAQRRTAGDLAVVLGVGAHTVGRRLSGASPFSVIEMVVTAEWLGIAPEVLVRRAERHVARAQKLAAVRVRQIRAKSTVAS